MKKFFAGILVVCFSFILSAQQDERLHPVLKKLEAKDYNGALVLMDKLIKDSPQEKDFYMLRSDIYMAKRDKESALSNCFTALALDTADPDVLFEIGYIYERTGDMDSALLYYHTAMQVTDDEKEILAIKSEIAYVYVHQRKYKESIEMYEEILKLHPDDYAALNNVGDAYRMMGESRKAIPYLKKCLAMKPDVEEGYNNLGMLYSEVEEHDSALVIFNQGLDLFPKSAYLLNNRAYVFIGLENFDKAIADINKSLAIYPENSYAYRNRALAYFGLGLKKEACSDLKASQQLGFGKFYGGEVDELIRQKKCQ